MNRIRMRVPPPLQQFAHGLPERSAGIRSATKSSTVRAMRVPKFLRSLYDILQYEDQTILTWSKDGTFFQIFDTKRLEIVVLPKYFKHGKFASFQRQLNNFGFRKWTKTQSSVCTFSHHHLVRCHPQELAEFISRQPAAVGARPSAEAFTAKRKRSFTDLMRSPGIAEISAGTAKAIKRENGGYIRDSQATESNMGGAAHAGTVKCIPRWSADPVGLTKSSQANYGTPTSASLGSPELPFNFTVEELHDIILPSERQETRSSEKTLELRMLNDYLELAGSPYVSANHPGTELFPYWWDSETFFAPINRAHSDLERGHCKLGH
ncbi:hypothetical protein PHYBOEH_004669 [Phytophthora boehmeriae]|uniref:HSF-type DNA-binding domain-containing protein n=1 Tax=Phytophthora boehmeriae TaxID=109152 RepID=A0A8T1WNK2_9STRA|nr:hypothetical protein PHYBOEH_004669 [Phytophthora boehmeriae]